MTVRPAGAYLHADGRIVVVDGRWANWLDTQLPGGLVGLRRCAAEARDVDLVQLTTAVGIAAERWRGAVASAHGSRKRKLVAPAAEAAGPLLMTSSGVADQLGLTARAVRLACAQGRLPAERDATGRWLISAADAASYRERRAA